MSQELGDCNQCEKFKAPKEVVSKAFVDFCFSDGFPDQLFTKGMEMVGFHLKARSS